MSRKCDPCAVACDQLEPRRLFSGTAPQSLVGLSFHIPDETSTDLSTTIYFGAGNRFVEAFEDQGGMSGIFGTYAYTRQGGSTAHIVFHNNLGLEYADDVTFSSATTGSLASDPNFDVHADEGNFTLQKRTAPSAMILVNTDSLGVFGTDGSDKISVSFDDDAHSIVVNTNGNRQSFESPVAPGSEVEFIPTVEVTAYAGNDTIDISGPSSANHGVYVNGGSGNDTIIGGDGDDTLTGAGGADHIDGRGGRDRLNALDGNDVLNGGDGVDRLFGAAGNDLLDGGKSTDYIYGEGGNDTVLGSDGQDWLDGGSGEDSIDGGAGEDTIFGQSGNDTLVGGEGHDFVFGNSGDDDLQLRDFTSDNADGGSGIDKAVIDDFERADIVAETRLQ